MRMALGDFRFIVPTFSIEKMGDQTGSRVARQAVIGSAPITHLLGPESDELTWESTFFPLHLNRGGPALLAALHSATRSQTPLPLMNVQGLIGYPQGRWIITSISNQRERFTSHGTAQVIQTSMTLERYVQQGTSGVPFGIF